LATPTYDLLDSTTLASSASSVTFTSIDQSYGDLVVVIDSKGTSTTAIYSYYNSDFTNANYSYVNMTTLGASPSSNTASNPFVGFEGSSLGQSLSLLHIMDYSATDKHKSYLCRNNLPDLLTQAIAGRWSNSSAVSSVTLQLSSGNLVSGSTFYLYGIAK